MRKEIETEEFKKISLDILVAVHEFCQENNIKYSLACGTLIGAVRHKGFIPWDDDVDIYMVRDDYNRFVRLFPEIYEDNYVLLSLERSSIWNYPYAKVYDSRTRCIEDKKYDYPNIGIGIDIFPIDNVPADIGQWALYEKKRKFLRNFYVMKELRWRAGRNVVKNLLVLLCSIVLFPISKRKLALLLSNYAQKYNFNETGYLAENCLGKPNARIEVADFSDTLDWPFENHFLKIMVGYDDYLKRFYGDYMKLPPTEEQVTHHRFAAYWTE